MPRSAGGTLRRFSVPRASADRASAALAAHHPALLEARSIFPSTVVQPSASPRLLVSGHNAAKIGARIVKGPWRGLPVYTLTLEERATCPVSCHLWAECYGNAMPFARRHFGGRELEAVLSQELAALAAQHTGGFAVRLHVLGDFYSVRYAARWAVWLHRIPQLHVFGFTAHLDHHAAGQMVERMNGRFPDRCVIRFSRRRPTGQGFEATTIWRRPEGPRVPEGLVCPAQTGRTECCATCGLCWHPAAAATPIVFIGHGRRSTGRPPSIVRAAA